MPDIDAAFNIAIGMVEAQTNAVIYGPIEIDEGPDFMVMVNMQRLFADIDLYVKDDLAKLATREQYIEHLYVILIESIEAMEAN